MSDTQSRPAGPHTRSLRVLHRAEHAVEIVCDSGEGAQKCGQTFASVAAKMGKGVWTVEIIPAEIQPPPRTPGAASGVRVRLGTGPVTNWGDAADMVIAFTVTREQKTTAFVDPGVRVYYPSTVGPYTYGGMAMDVDQYTEGTLKFHIFDRETHELLCTGFGSKRLTKDHEPKETIELAVQQIFTKFPPPAS